MRIEEKLRILANAAKYDASCTSSGSRRKNGGRSLGSAAPAGICHTYTEDGRCVSLLKILYTNACRYNCAYCINRRDNDIARAAFASHEVVWLTIDFYRRNYIEGLFLSSGIMRSPDDTMERLARTVKRLRAEGFNGYIHLKCVPFASRRLVREAGRYADRLSVNIELPSEESLLRLTREKTYASVLTPMNVIQASIAESREDRKLTRHAPQFAPAGQSTQLIVGASPENDLDILRLSSRLYRDQALKRVYYSAYVPVNRSTSDCPEVTEPPLARENRLYQADWLMRLYGFSIDELVTRDAPWLDLRVDPKQAFALRHPNLFPVDVNLADRERLLRVPGIGLRSANRIVALRKKGRLRLEHLRHLGAVVSRALPYIRCDGLRPDQWPAHPTLPSSRHSTRAWSSKPNAGAPRRRIFETDGSFEGLLTALFAAYASGRQPDVIAVADRTQIGLFEERVAIETDRSIAERVWKGLKQYLKSGDRRRLLHAYLSEHPEAGTLIHRWIVERIATHRGSTADADLSTIIALDQLCQKVRREAHRVKGLARFQQTRGNRFVAVIAPRYDVLPLVRQHFERRFADQRWTIYDHRRSYGIAYDRRRTRRVQLKTEALAIDNEGQDRHEQRCQTLWRCYYRAANIKERNNPKSHRSRLPRRYWPYLTEKKLGRGAPDGTGRRNEDTT